MASDVRITSGQMEFSGGVDSSKVPLIKSAMNPNGLDRNQIAWGDNVICRGGGIECRTGWAPLCKVHDGTALYQGGLMYDDFINKGNPYLMLSIGGRMYQVRVDTDNSVVDVTGAFADPPAAPQAYFVQGQQFLIKQAGDGVTLPLFWDGTSLRRSKGITTLNIYPGTPGVNELPAATAMVYYMGRIWYAQNLAVSAGDIVDGASGTLAYDFTDSILEVTENPLAIGGDGFAVPAQAGIVTALNFPISLDQTFGQGPLFIFTNKQIYSLTVPVTRADWIAAGATNGPLLAVVMNTNGTCSDRSVVPLNGDLFYQSLDPAIRSFFMALRYFQTWGNAGISNNINQALAFNNRALMNVATGIEFQNRLLQAILPVTTPVGTAFQAIGSLDLDPITTLQNQLPPSWDGIWEGLDILQLFQGNFGGLQRAFAVVHSRVDGSIEVWELSQADTTDNAASSPLSAGDVRIQWYVETPAFDFSEYPKANGGGPFALKELDGLDLWFDNVYGSVLIQVQYRQDENVCWVDWGTTEICAARNSAENVQNPISYPLEGYREQYRMPISFPKPKATVCQVGNKRPTTLGYKFQLRITVKGFAELRGFHLHAVPKEAAPFYQQIC